MFRLIKQIFIALSLSGSLACMTNISNFKICISLNNQPCVARPFLIDWNLDKYNQGLYYYPFMFHLDWCNWIWNAFDDPSGRKKM